jgi:hypothetical protein
MPFIITHSTDQHPVKYGYCSKCWTYNEVWRKEKTSICPKCKKKMIHISSRKIYVALAISVAVLLLSCRAEEPSQPAQPAQSIKSSNLSPLKDHFLMEEINHGLHLIEINDSTQVLIYRGVESCTMIQLK